MIDIDAEFEKFFEFPTDDRSAVSSVSCKLFARHVAEMVRGDKWKTCATHGGVDQSKAWACPDCYHKLKRDYAQLIALSQALSNDVGAHICGDYVLSKSTKGEDLFELCHRVDDHILERGLNVDAIDAQKRGRKQ